MRDKTYCTCVECPFPECEKNPQHLKGMKGYASFADLYKVCSSYINYMLEEIRKEEGHANGRKKD